MAFEIFVDTSIDIDKTVAESGNVHFVPMNYTFGNEERVCVGIEDEAFLVDFYNGQRKGDLTRTSQVTPQTYIDVFKPTLLEGKDVLYISLSSGLTKTFDSVNMAKNELEEEISNAFVYPVDSLSATGGMGLLVELAIQLRDEGVSSKEAADRLTEAAKKICHIFVVDDLMYLKRGGRVSAATAIVGTALNVKPILVIDKEGKLTNVDKKRGDKAAIKEIIERFKKSHTEGENRIYITHGDDIVKATALEEAVLALIPDAKITKMPLCPIIGAHTGPGMAALLFWGERMV